MSETNQNYTIMEGYSLPTGGAIYSKPVKANVELKSMTARDEMKRLSPSNTPLKTLADIIEGCMLEKPAISVYDMCVGDYEYLLHKLRIVTYGSDYKLDITCPYCGNNIESIANLDNLTVKEFNLEEFEALRSICLPKSGKTIYLNYKTPRMLDTIELKSKELKRKFKTAELDFDTFATLLSVIDTIDDKKFSQFELEQFITSLPAMDMNKILNAADKLNTYVGINNDLTVHCNKCGEDVYTFFRLGAEFFRPTTI